MSAAEPTVACGYAAALVKFAAGRGADRVALLEAAGMEVADLARHDERLPLGRFRALILAAKSATGDPALALRFGCEADMAEASVVGLIGRSAGTLPEAIALLNRYGRLIADVEHDGPERFRIEEDAERHWLVDRRCNPAAFPEFGECTIGRLVAVGRQLFPEADYVKAVEFAHPPTPYAKDYAEVLGVPVAFAGDADRIELDPAALDRPTAVQQPRYVLSILGGHADTLLARLDGRAGLRGEVEELLIESLPRGAHGQDQVAQRLGLSRRTLHRRLQAEGTTFERVLEALRRRLAEEHLGAGRSVKRTAHLLGFSDPAAFSRAYKRWTGASPLASRRLDG